MGRTALRRVCACVCALPMLAKPYDVAEITRTLHAMLCGDDRQGPDGARQETASR